jgi:hypothetical protein
MPSFEDMQQQLDEQFEQAIKERDAAKARNDAPGAQAAERLRRQIAEALDELAIKGMRDTAAKLDDFKRQLEAARHRAEGWPLTGIG